MCSHALCPRTPCTNADRELEGQQGPRAASPLQPWTCGQLSPAVHRAKCCPCPNRRGIASTLEEKGQCRQVKGFAQGHMTSRQQQTGDQIGKEVKIPLVRHRSPDGRLTAARRPGCGLLPGSSQCPGAGGGGQPAELSPVLSLLLPRLLPPNLSFLKTGEPTSRHSLGNLSLQVGLTFVIYYFLVGKYTAILTIAPQTLIRHPNALWLHARCGAALKGWYSVNTCRMNEDRKVQSADEPIL